MIDSRLRLYAAPVSLTLFLLYQYWRRPKIHHPPSPSSLPLVGNLFSIPPDHEHLAFSKLGEQLKSDIIFLEVLGQKIVVLNSAEAALELLEKRSAHYSDRPIIPMIHDPELMNWSTTPSLTGYNDLWRHYRRMMNNWLNMRDVTQFNGAQEQQAQSLLGRLLGVASDSQPFKRMKEEFYFSMGSLMLQLAYGYKPRDSQDRFFKEAKLTLHNIIIAGAQTNFLVNIFPALSYIPNWFPGTDWKHIGKEYGAQQERAKTEPFEWVKAQIAAGTHQPSLLSHLLQDQKLLSGLSPAESDKRVKEIGITLFGGGADTSASFLVNLVIAMVLNPHVQAKAQQELDDVLGQAVLPSVSDQGRLPYVKNLIYEVLRMYPVLPLGVPHMCFRDDVFRGYNIQKGTTMIGNIWAIGRDPRHYPNPEVFDPDRYLDTKIPRPPAFGWGRRKCPGIHFGEISTFITTASILAMFRFSKKRDINGQEIVPLAEVEGNALVAELKSFEFEFEPRTDEHRQLILEAEANTH